MRRRWSGGRMEEEEERMKEGKERERTGHDGSESEFELTSGCRRTPSVLRTEVPQKLAF